MLIVMIIRGRTAPKVCHVVCPIFFFHVILTWQNSCLVPKSFYQQFQVRFVQILVVYSLYTKISNLSFITILFHKTFPSVRKMQWTTQTNFEHCMVKKRLFRPCDTPCCIVPYHHLEALNCFKPLICLLGCSEASKSLKCYRG